MGEDDHQWDLRVMKTYYLIQMLEIGSRSLNLQNFSKTIKSIGYVPPCLCFLLSIHGWEYRKGTAEISYLVTNERAWDDQWMTNGRSMNPILSIYGESPYSYSWVNFPCNQHNEQVGAQHTNLVNPDRSRTAGKQKHFKVGLTMGFLSVGFLLVGEWWKS